VGIWKRITILILYQVNSSHASIQHFFFFLCFQLIPLPPNIPPPFLKCVPQFSLFRLRRLKSKHSLYASAKSGMSFSVLTYLFNITFGKLKYTKHKQHNRPTLVGLCLLFQTNQQIKPTILKRIQNLQTSTQNIPNFICSTSTSFLIQYVLNSHFI